MDVGVVGRRQVLAEAVEERRVRGLGVASRAGEEDQGAAFAPSARADDVPVIVGGDPRWPVGETAGTSAVSIPAAMYLLSHPGPPEGCCLANGVAVGGLHRFLLFWWCPAV